MGINIRQLNVGRRGAVFDDVTAIFDDPHAKSKPMVIFLHELASNRIGHGQIFKYEGRAPRAGILIHDDVIQNCGCHLLHDFTNKDMTAVDMKIETCKGVFKEIVLCSIYFPSDTKTSEMITKELISLVSHCNNKRKELIIGCDSNAHNEVWGSKRTNVRGEMLMDFILENGLQLMNIGCEPTFMPDPLNPNHRSSIIDLTLATRGIAELIHDWKVLNIDSHSDHRWIDFKLASENIAPELKRNKRSTNWDKFLTELNGLENLKNLDIDMSTDELDKAASTLNSILIRAFNKACKKRIKVKFRKQPWFNGELQALRKKVRDAFRAGQSSGDPALKSCYKKLRDSYRKKCHKAKRTDWRRRMENLEKVNDTSRLQKFMENGPQKLMSTIKKPDGSFTSDIVETQQVLMETHFDGVVTLEENQQWINTDPPELMCGPEDRKEILDCTEESKIKWAIDNFSPFKSPGEDEVFPALLQKSRDLVTPILQTLFRASLLTGYIPIVWRGTMVTFIPKAGRENYGVAGAYRPISLMSFVLKTLEKLIDKKIRATDLVTNPLDKDQHAYKAGRSTDSALHSMITHAEKALEFSGYCLATFIDISGAFDQTSTRTIVKAAESKNISKWTTRWIQSMLQNRRVKTSCVHCDKRFCPNRGCPQGGVLSPLLWSLVADSLIVRLKQLGLIVTAFADDLCIMNRDHNLCNVRDQMNVAMKCVGKWCLETGLNVNPDKTQMMLFTRKHIYSSSRKSLMRPLHGKTAGGCQDISENRECKLKGVFLRGKELTLSKDVKYLGVHLDQRLTMKNHIDAIVSKANRAFWAVGALCGRYWGLQPRRVLYIYKSIILPRITYGSIVFWHKLHSSYNGNNSRIKTIATVQRRAALFISGAMKTTPTIPLLAILKLTPIDIHICRRALETYVRLKGCGAWLNNGSPGGHTDITGLANGVNLDIITSDITPTWVSTKNFNTQCAITLNIPKNCAINAFCDASIRDNVAGLGIHIPFLNIREKMAMRPCSNINFAEMAAIGKVATRLSELGLNGRKIIVWTDSLGAIEKLKSPMIKDRFTLECMNSLEKLALKNVSTTVAWIPKKALNRDHVIANNLARAGLQDDQASVTCTAAPTVNTEKIKLWIVKEEAKRWNGVLNSTGHRVAKIMIRGFSDDRLSESYNHGRKGLRTLSYFFTGAVPLRSLLVKMGLATTDSCRFCNDGKEEIMHLLVECRACEIVQARLESFGFLPMEHELVYLKIKDLLRFAKEIRLDEITKPTQRAQLDDSDFSQS